MLHTARLRFSKTPTAAIRIGGVYPIVIPIAIPIGIVTAFALGLATQSAFAQDWGADPSDDRYAPQAPEYSGGSAARTGWSIRTGLGFTADPDTFLLNFELPYAFDRWVSSAGFLVNFGFGLEYQLSERFFLGSQMMFNFLPEETLDEKFFYSWQIGGLRIAF